MQWLRSRLADEDSQENYTSAFTAILGLSLQEKVITRRTIEQLLETLERNHRIKIEIDENVRGTFVGNWYGRLIELLLEKPDKIDHGLLEAWAKAKLEEIRGRERTAAQTRNLCAIGFASIIPHNASSQGASVSAFEIQTTTVTQCQWKAIMGANSASGGEASDSFYPMDFVSLLDAKEFASRLNGMASRNDHKICDFVPDQEFDRRYRLPINQEWEYLVGAAGRMPSDDCSVMGVSILNHAWLAANSGGETHEVKTRMAFSIANAFVYDIYGNVWQWIAPDGLATGRDWGIVRGGSYASTAEDSKLPRHLKQDRREKAVGFRLVRYKIEEPNKESWSCLPPR